LDAASQAVIQPDVERMHSLRFISGLCLSGLLLSACANRSNHRSKESGSAEARAVDFLKREVPAWSRDNGCFSCHNNGDAARALYAASRKGYRIPKSVLAETTEWVAHPERWDDNKGDPGFSDKRLADVQFAASLAAALESGAVRDRHAMQPAAHRVAQGQWEDGSWPIDVANPAGSPATYGVALATYMAWNSLKHATHREASIARAKAEERLKAIKPDSVPNAAVLVLYLASQGSKTRGLPLAGRGGTIELSPTSPLAAGLDFLRRAQTSDGGWGPYLDSPPEAFDSSLALLALARFRSEVGVSEMIQRGRRFLVTTQLPDGSWPATTRPSGGQSYAQQISTTGWATLALLATR
jgi:hypothetical protein